MIVSASLVDGYGVEVDVSGLPAGTATITVERTVGADVRPVRGGRAAPVAGDGALLWDWEAPLGVGVGYRVLALDADGVQLGASGFTSVATPGVERPDVVLSDPLEGGSARLVHALDGTDAQRGWVRPVSQVHPSGVAADPLLHVPGRASVQPWPLTRFTETQADSDELREFLLSAAFLLVRPPAGIGLPPLLYGQPASITERPHLTGASTWDMPLTLSGGPLVHLLTSVWTYGDLEALGILYGDLPSMFPTYRDLQRGPA